MYAHPSGILMSLRLLQLENAFSLIPLHLFGKVILLRPEH